MDALKKAELAKRKAQPEGAAASEPTAAVAAPLQQTRPAASGSQIEPSISFSANPAEPTLSTGTASLPNLPDNLQLLDGEFDTHPGSSGLKEFREQSPNRPFSASGAFSLQEIAPGPGAAAETATMGANADTTAQERESVQNLFETKQAAPSRKMFGIAIGVASLCAVAAIGLYFWMQLQPKSGLVAGNAVRTSPASKPVASITPAQGSPANDMVMQPAAPAIAGLPPARERTEAPDKPAVTADTPDSAAVNVAASQQQNKKLFRLTAAQPQANLLLDRAYDALARGDNAAAKSAYEQVLGNDPKNADALAGLAVIAQNNGSPEAAADYYLQMLDADPKSPVALAGLINLQSQMDPNLAETRLKQALATQPDSPALNFSLGNLYARNRRWTEGQQAYFRAMTGDPSNPDYLFNLAVSLDQLKQPKLATKYYASAIAAANSRPAAFDKTKAGERLQTLQQLP